MGLRAAGLDDVQVVSRMVYEPEQVKAIVATDFADAGLPPGAWDRYLPAIAGMVASITVTGRKPRASCGCGAGPCC